MAHKYYKLLGIMLIISSVLLVWLYTAKQPKLSKMPQNTQTATKYFSGNAKDFSTLFDLNDFHYVLQQPPCSPHVKVLILIHTAPSNWDKRKLIRKTWARLVTVESRIRINFLIGTLAPSDNEEERQNIQSQLLEENRIHADFVQGSFVDSYRNLTYKHGMALKWFCYECPAAESLIKVDDDVLLNTLQIAKYLDFLQDYDNAAQSLHGDDNKHLKLINQLFNKPKELIYCSRFDGNPVIREPLSRYYVSREAYARDVFPTHCSGFYIMYSADIVFRLYREMQLNELPYVSADDAYISGIVAEKINATVQDFDELLLHEAQYRKMLDGEVMSTSMDYIFVGYEITPEEKEKLWLLNINEHYFHLRSHSGG